jgi:hypothetical protein
MNTRLMAGTVRDKTAIPVGVFYNSGSRMRIKLWVGLAVAILTLGVTLAVLFAPWPLSGMNDVCANRESLLSQLPWSFADGLAVEGTLSVAPLGLSCMFMNPTSGASLVFGPSWAGTVIAALSAIASVYFAAMLVARRK